MTLDTDKDQFKREN